MLSPQELTGEVALQAQRLMGMVARASRIGCEFWELVGTVSGS